MAELNWSFLIYVDIINRDDFNVSVCYFKEKGSRGEQLEKESYDVFNLPGLDRNKNKYLSLRLRPY